LQAIEQLSGSKPQSNRRSPTTGKVLKIKQKLWFRGRALDSQTEGRGFNPCPMPDGSGVKAMPGSIPAPNSGSL